jgi:fibronectin type 3 domain-containing protein
MKKFFKAKSRKLLAVLGIAALVVAIGFSMTACDDGGGGTPVTIPATPSGVRATAVSSTEIQVTWNAVPGAASYTVYNSLSPVSDFYPIDGAEAERGTSITNFNLPPGTTVYYRVTAKNSAGESQMSSPVSAKTQSGGGGATPGKPTGFNVVITSTMLQASWNPVSGAMGYVLVVSVSPDFDEDLSDGILCSGTTYTEDIRGSDVPAGTMVYFSVVPFNANGMGEPSDIVSRAWPASGTSYSLDGVWKSSWDNIVTITGNSGVFNQIDPSPRWQDAIRKGWVKLGDQKFKNITKTGDRTWSCQEFWVAYREPDFSTAVDRGFDNNITITLSANGQTFETSLYGPTTSTFTNETWTRYTGSLPAAAPTGLVTTGATVSSISLSWNASSGAAGYRVYRSSSLTGTYTQVETTSGTTYTNTGLTATTTYYYKVSAYNSAGESAQSGYVYATTLSDATTYIIIKGTPNVGATLTATLSGSGWTGNYYWGYADADKVDGNYTIISGVNGTTLTITSAYKGKCITAFHDHPSGPGTRRSNGVVVANGYISNYLGPIQ